MALQFRSAVKQMTNVSSSGNVAEYFSFPPYFHSFFDPFLIFDYLPDQLVQRCRVSINQIGVVMVNKWLTLNNNHDWCQRRVLQTTTQITIAVADEGNNNKKNQSTYSIFTREKWFDIQLYWFQIKSFRFFSSCIEFDLTLGKRSESSSWTALKLLSNCSQTALELLLNCSWIALELLWNCSGIALELLWNCSGSCALKGGCLRRLKRRGTDRNDRAVD